MPKPVVVKPLLLPSLWRAHPEQPFAPYKRFKPLTHYITDPERELIHECLPDIVDDEGIIESLRALMLTRMSPTDCRELTWKEIMALLKAIRSRNNSAAPVGYLSIRDIRQEYKLDLRETDKIKKRLARWRRGPGHEEQCRRETDAGTGREMWTYPAHVVEEIMEKGR
jgi:hypothetical protein